MANNTGRKFGGRKKGAPNKRSLDAKELAEKHGADPLTFLIKVVKGDLREFGYEDRVVVREREHKIKKEQRDLEIKKGKKLEPVPPLRKLTKAEAQEMNLLSLDVRTDAAKDLMPYIYPKLKHVEVDHKVDKDVIDDILGDIDGQTEEDWNDPEEIEGEDPEEVDQS